MSMNPNWDKLDQLTRQEQYRLLLSLTQKLSLRKMDELIRRQKLLSIDSAMWSEVYRFKNICNSMSVNPSQKAASSQEPGATS
jgi:hypothetical protein